MKSKKVDIFLEKALNKMFQMVGFAGFDKSFTKQENWYNKKEWEEREYLKFKDWFAEEAKKDLKWSKLTTEKEFSYFNLMWGWKIKEPTV